MPPEPVAGGPGRALLVLALAALAGSGGIAALALRGEAADIVGAEPYVVHATQRLALGHPLYQDPEEPPYAAVQYAPLLYQAGAAVLRASGAEARDPALATRALRAVSVSCWTLAAALLAWRLLAAGAGAAASLALTAWWTVQSGVWWFLARPDSAEALFFVAALAALGRAVRDPRVRPGWVVASALLGVAAGYAKQNGWQAHAILVAVLLAHGARGSAALALGAIAAGHAVLHGWAWQAWGEAWPRQAFGMLDNGIRFDRAWALAYAPTGLQAGAVLAMAGALAWRWKGREGQGERRALAIAWLLTMAFAAAAALKIGSADNYFIDAFAASALLLGHGAAELRRRGRSWEWAATAGGAYLALWAPFKLHESWRAVAGASGYAELRPAGARLTALLDAAPGGWAFADDARLACLEPERTVCAQLLLHELAKARGTFRYRGFPGFVARGDLAVLALRQAAPDLSAARLLGADLADFQDAGATGPWRFHVHPRRARRPLP